MAKTIRLSTETSERLERFPGSSWDARLRAALDQAGHGSIVHAETAEDGTRIYRGPNGRELAFAGSPQSIVERATLHPDWQCHGSPEQQEGLFLMTAPGCMPDEIPLDPGRSGWRAMEIEEIATFYD